MTVSPAVTHLLGLSSPSTSKRRPRPPPSPGQSVLSCWSHDHTGMVQWDEPPHRSPLDTTSPNACPSSAYALSQVTQQNRFSLCICTGGTQSTKATLLSLQTLFALQALKILSRKCIQGLYRWRKTHAVTTGPRGDMYFLTVTAEGCIFYGK